MTELSPDLKKLVNIAHDAMSPSEQQVRALRNALDARLAESSGPEGGGPTGGGGSVSGAFGALGALGALRPLRPWSAMHLVGISCVLLGVIAGAVELWGRAASGAEARHVREQVLVATPPMAAQDIVGLAGDVPSVLPAKIETPAPRKAKAQRARGRSEAADRASAVASRQGAEKSSASASTDSSTITGGTRSEARAEDKQNEAKVAATIMTAASHADNSSPPSEDSLAQEVALLARARAELTKEPAVALALAEQHAERFPRGTLRQEQLATRMRALCALGRSSDARSVLRELEQTSRRSPHLMSIDARCLKEASLREAP